MKENQSAEPLNNLPKGELVSEWKAGIQAQTIWDFPSGRSLSVRRDVGLVWSLDQEILHAKGN